MAPSYSSLFMGKLEADFLAQRGNKLMKGKALRKLSNSQRVSFASWTIYFLYGTTHWRNITVS